MLALYHFFIWACRRGGGNHLRVRKQNIPAAVPSGFTLQWLAISENGDGQFLPFGKSPTVRNGLPASHFRCNPSRKLVECYTRFAASTAQPRLKGLPRRACPTHHSLPRVAALVPRSLTPGYQSLVPDGAMSRKIATPPDTRT